MIGPAGWDMRSELIGLWQICFHEPRRYPNYFMNNCFRPEDCLVYRISGQIAAAVYLLPARIAPDGVQAHYIFAAGTLPSFRSRGFMASLLAYAALYGANRGDRYSVVLPASQPLYSFYERCGYFDYYKIRSVPVVRARLEQLASQLSPGRVLACSSELNRLRNSVLSRRKGSVLWSDERFHFTMGFGSTYGDELVCSGSEGRRSYAICRRTDGKACSVREAIAVPGGFPGLAAAILERFPAETYEFRLPPGGGLFSGEGAEERCGMLRPIGGTKLEEPVVSAPYLGLALD
ncbi:GNAT family N-acetyltransferase [Caproiciproducens sp. NJN-50]|uniref:GNAT family N-acetyltransferase n=1 Tax=Acutalibacteraceae TaxID=3082771 RepID=UPI000FFDFC13|nr:MULTISPECIES: GNAT family N-acetyltransferase [Acutalibacteraceae]QAT49570.1 GNAT family N-acetyltransferase [Caproiciproducens sp. NJN-50]